MRFPAVLLAVMLLLPACAGASAPTASGNASDVASAAQGDGALDFTATTVDGAEFVGGDYAGQDLMLWFWAPW